MKAVSHVIVDTVGTLVNAEDVDERFQTFDVGELSLHFLWHVCFCCRARP